SVVEGPAPGVKASITKDGDKTPYLRAEITHTDEWAPTLPESAPPDYSRPLPYYRNCFVCGHYRTEAGLQRRFRAHPKDDGYLVTCLWDGVEADRERVGNFLIGKDELHPAVLSSIFDENTAWAGFMKTRAGALSTRMSFRMLRPVNKNERLVFIGWDAGIRGNPKAPRFFRGGGVVASMNDSGDPEPILYGTGEWIILDQYTKQIKQNLLPEDDWQWVFEDDSRISDEVI
ncbi:MAG: hypothetical protein V2B18_10665, partial [Pseudomonadota bacterium]